MPSRILSGLDYWLMSGAVNGEKVMLAAVAISEGNRFLKWRIVKIPYAPDKDLSSIKRLFGQVSGQMKGDRSVLVGNAGGWTSANRA